MQINTENNLTVVNQKPNLPVVQSKVNSALKNFFFFAFKRGKRFKALEKEIGHVKSITIIIVPNEKAILRSITADNKKFDSEFTEKELNDFKKTFKIKEETIQQSKVIFAMIDFDLKSIFIQQKKLDGKKTEIAI